MFRVQKEKGAQQHTISRNLLDLNVKTYCLFTDIIRKEQRGANVKDSKTL